MKWGAAPLSEVAMLERNSISPADIKSGSRYVGLDHIEAGGGSIRFGSVTNGELASNKFQFGPNHILFGKLRPYLAKVVCPDFEGICSTDIIPIAPGKLIDKRYLLHFLRRPETITWATGRATGVNLPRISPKELASLEIPLPPLDEQQRIASILDKADALRRKRRRAIDLLDSLPQSIFLEMFGEATENPHNFPPCELGELCEFRGGSQPPKSTFSYEPGPDTVRLIQIRDYKSDDYATYIPRNLAKRPCSTSDVMIGRYGPPLFQILKGLEGSYNVALMKADPKPKITRVFLFHLLRSPKLQADVISQSERSAGQTGVNLKFLNVYPAYFPPEKPQFAFEQIVKRQEFIRERSMKAMSLADGAFYSLQSSAFSGQL